MKRTVVFLLLSCVPLLAQDAAIKATNDTPDGAMVVSKEPPRVVVAAPPVVNPLKTELDAPDMRRVLTAQREKFFWTAKAQEYRAEMEAQHARMNEAEQELRLWNKEIDNLVIELQKRYNCPGCTLQGDMKWKMPEIPKPQAKD